MRSLSEIFKKNLILHHAYAIQGEKTAILPDLLKFLNKEHGVEFKNNPDFQYQEFETFTIDDGRALQERHSRRAIAAKKIFIIATRFITGEAQNALLKIFEEPSEGAHFFLIMPNLSVLLPTLRSRMVVIDARAGADDLASFDGLKGESEMKDLANRFVASSPSARLILVKSIVEEKDKGRAIDLVTALERTLAPRLTDIKITEKTALAENTSSLVELLVVKKYLHDRAPSVKLLLEHLCLSVTMVKP